MRVLVTGACGFVGRYLVRHLGSCGDSVLAACLRTDTPTHLPWVRHVEIDVTSREQMRSLFAAEQIDAVVHLAGIAFAPDAAQDFHRTLQINVGAVQVLLETVKEQRERARVVLVSSGEVYGRGAETSGALKETDPIRPGNPYGISKHLMEVLANHYAREYSLPLVIFRPFNHIGPGQNERFVAANFAAQLDLIARGEREAVVRVGNIKAERDFSDVRDIVRAYRIGLRRGSGTYNLGSGKAVPVSEILYGLIKAYGLEGKVRVEVDPSRLRPNEVPTLFGDISRAKADLGWEPEIDLATTLQGIAEG